MTTPYVNARKPLWLTILGIVCLLGFAAGAYLALVVSPPDARGQGDLIRVMYAHVSVAWIFFLATAVSAFWSARFLWKGKTQDDVRAVATGEAALFYSVLTIVGGMTYAKPTLNTFWTWDAKLTLTALMVALLAGYFIVRALIVDPVKRGRVSAVVMIVVAATLPLNYLAAEWFRTLHPARSINLDGSGTSMGPELLRILLINTAVAGLVFWYFVSERIRIGMFRVKAGAALEGNSVRKEAVHVQ